jgi:hypothetical protein
MNENTLFTKEEIDGVAYSSCIDAGNEEGIEGEQAHFPCGGYLLDIYPRTDTA